MASVSDLVLRQGVAENAVYRWKLKFGGIEAASEAKRLCELEQEIAKLKRLLGCG